MRSNNTTKIVASISLLVALNVIIVRFLSIQLPVTRFDFGFVTTSLAGIIFGPTIGVLVGGLSDIVGMLINSKGQVYFPLFTISQMLYGLIYAIFLYKKPKTWGRVIMCCAVNFLCVNIVFMSFAMYIYYTFYLFMPKGTWFIISARLINASILFPIQIVVIKILCQYVYPQIKRVLMLEKKDKFINYANSFQENINLGLSRVNRLLELFGNPQNGLKFIHIAGTNGKGSVCTFLSSALTKAGYKTGKYISPNMLRVNERISIDGLDISDEDLNGILHEIEQYSKQIEREFNEQPTQFEIWTVAGFIYFARQKCDFVALEVGLGGRLDATNVITSPILSIITRIDIDHKEYLGDTIESVAYEKAGIIKHGSPVIVLDQRPEVIDVIRNRASELNSEVIVVEPCLCNAPGLASECISYKNFENVQLGIGGEYQAENASLALECLSVLQNRYFYDKITGRAVLEGFRDARNPGRFEILSADPFIIFDGAHNLNGATALKRSIDRYFPNEELTYIMAFMKDKEIEKCLAILQPKFCIFTKVKNNPRAITTEGLKSIGDGLGIENKTAENVGQALEIAKSRCNKIIICGSLYTYKDVREIIK